MRRRDHLAKSLSESKYRQRIVVARKGTGSYNRKRIKKEHTDVRQGS